MATNPTPSPVAADAVAKLIERMRERIGSEFDHEAHFSDVKVEEITTILSTLQASLQAAEARAEQAGRDLHKAIDRLRAEEHSHEQSGISRDKWRARFEASEARARRLEKTLREAEEEFNRISCEGVTEILNAGDILERTKWFADRGAKSIRAAISDSPAPTQDIDEGWQSPQTIPNVPKGSERIFIVAVRRARNGNVYVYPASYLNAYPLRFEYECPKGDGCDGEGCDDGCPTTGWYDATGDGDDGLTYSPVHMGEGDEFLGWRKLPAWETAPAQAPAVTEDWRDDPSADERWNAGLDFALEQLCAFLGADPKQVNWDAATETLDGDVQAVIGNILRQHFGEDWGPKAALSRRDAVEGWVMVPQHPSRAHLERLAHLWGYTIEETADSYATFLEALPASPSPDAGREG